MRSRMLVFLGSALLGAGAGWFLVQRQNAQGKSDLFSPQPLKRPPWVSNIPSAPLLGISTSAVICQDLFLVSGAAPSVIRTRPG